IGRDIRTVPLRRPGFRRVHDRKTCILRPPRAGRQPGPFHSPIGDDTSSTDSSVCPMSWLGSIAGGETKPSDANPCKEVSCNRNSGSFWAWFNYGLQQFLRSRFIGAPASAVSGTAWMRDSGAERPSSTEATNEIDFSGGIAWCAAILRKGPLVEIGPRSVLTLPTKVPSDSLGRIGSLKRSSDKSLFPMASGSCGHRITHQLRPINMNGHLILSVTSVIGK